MREEVDSIKENVEVRKEVSARPNNKAGIDSNGNGIKQIRLNSVRTKSKEGTGKNKYLT